eukprot:CAMPEP_0198155168 /NCGR_PEP_ID=MMETSP1443-20131203/68993_1 /TAXON_ID=186043 /ORGANISM="Entomoneis sp., Strain CCMP2396" /LENGTH=309 /DNA_ID=CAMNT_0043821909 /DNA_START=382 /DNA_END=1309 /DNA_ORIENTATION=+
MPLYPPTSQDLKNEKESSLDRSIRQILINPDATASRQKSNICLEVERLHLVQDASLIRSACYSLQLPTSCYGTACCIFHRYFHAVSLQEVDVWSVAAASTLIAAKTHEVLLILKQVIVVFAHLYRQRRMIYLQSESTTKAMLQHKLLRNQPELPPDVFSSGKINILKQVIVVFAHLYRKRRMIYLQSESITKAILHHKLLRNQTELPPECLFKWQDKQTALKKVPGLSLLGPVYKEWYDAIVKVEILILRQLGLTFYWIPHSHPHKYIDGFLDAVICQLRLAWAWTWTTLQSSKSLKVLGIIAMIHSCW